MEKIKICEYEILPEDTEEICSCPNGATQAIVKTKYISGHVVFLCRNAAKQAFEELDKMLVVVNN